MTSLLIDDCISIFDFPTADTSHPADNNAQITIGDMHGNAMKFIYMLVRHGVITNMTAEQYADLVEIYTTDIDKVTNDTILKFNNIISSLQWNRSATIRLIGDELCDRGSNDYFTMKIIERLHDNNVPFEIIMSNHSIEFIEAYETKNKFFPTVLENKFATSMINMQILIARKIITREEVIKIIRKAYKPHLKVLSYTLNEDQTDITIYSHAPIDLRAIRAIAGKLSVTYDNETTSGLANTIDEINKTYQTHVKNNTVHTLYSKDAMEEGYSVIPFPAMSNPFEYIMWNRDLRYLMQPALHKGFKLFFVHGHDSTESENTNVINLDNQLGKTIFSNVGQYTVLYSHEHQLNCRQSITRSESPHSDRESLRFSFSRRSSTRNMEPHEVDVRRSPTRTGA